MHTTNSRRIKRIIIGIGLLAGLLYLATLIAARTTLTQHVLQADITIAAPAGDIWRILADFDAYSEWNPQFLRASGVAEQNTRLTLETSVMTLKLTVLAAQPERELRWRGSVILPIFDAEHSFSLEPLGEDRVQVVQREVFRGLLIPFSGKLLRNTEAKLHAVNRALKKRAERK